MNTNSHIIYTVGHSTHQLDYFLQLLQKYNITCVVDVRSVPASAYNQQFNREPLKAFLKRNNITYLSFASEFGARQTDPNLLNESGKVDFIKVRNGSSFKHGLERIWQGINKGYVIAIMCSESDPLICHRFSMVSVGLVNDGFIVKHILKDKSVKEHLELEKELVKKYEKNILQLDIFMPSISDYEELKNKAYILRNGEIGYSVNSINNDNDYD